MRRPALATLVLSLLALLFGWETRQALRETPGGQDNASTAGVWKPGVSAPDPQPPPDPTPMAAAVAARPLFRPDRQPFRGEGASGRNYEAELSRYTLLGILDFGDVPYGVVVGKTGNKGERWEVRRGDSLPGFKVKEVGMDGVRLTADGKEFLLPLYAGAPAVAPAGIRTGTPRGDAALPASAPVPAAPPRVGAAPRTGAPAVVPGPAVPTTSTVPGPTPQIAPSAPRALPGAAPRYIPGRR